MNRFPSPAGKRYSRLSTLVCRGYFFFVLLLAAGAGQAIGQEIGRPHFLAPADTFQQKRFWLAAGSGTVIYGGAAYGLYQSWYRNYELIGFHTFDDSREWQQMDKWGHLFTTQMEANLIYAGARWTGMSPRASTWTAAGIALWLQSTIEIMDGFSAKWGFSWADMAANAAGAGLFVGQQYLWGEQRILMKVSSDLWRQYPNTPVYSRDGAYRTTPAERAAELFGGTLGEHFIKDYNRQTIWASFNIRSFAGKQSRLPGWLNLAVGYGSENMYGGFSNTWTDPQTGAVFALSPDIYPRYRQYYLSPDMDLTRIKTNSRLLRTLFRCISFVKIPAPALELNGLGQVRWHWLHW